MIHGYAIGPVWEGDITLDEEYAPRKSHITPFEGRTTANKIGSIQSCYQLALREQPLAVAS